MMLCRATLRGCSSRVAAPGITVRSLSASALLRASDGSWNSSSRWDSGTGSRTPRQRSDGDGRDRGPRRDTYGSGSARIFGDRDAPPRRDNYGSREGGSGPGDGNRNFYNRSERFAADGSRKRPPSTNNRNQRGSQDSQNRSSDGYGFQGSQDRDSRGSQGWQDRGGSQRWQGRSGSQGWQDRGSSQGRQDRGNSQGWQDRSGSQSRQDRGGSQGWQDRGGRQDRSPRSFGSPQDGRSRGFENSQYRNQSKFEGSPARESPDLPEGEGEVMHSEADASSLSYSDGPTDLPSYKDRSRDRFDRPSRHGSSSRKSFEEEAEDEPVAEEEEEEEVSSKSKPKSKLPSLGGLRRNNSRKPVNIFADEEDADYEGDEVFDYEPPVKRSSNKPMAMVPPPDNLDPDVRMIERTLRVKPKIKKVNKEIFLPPTVTVAMLGQKLGVKQAALQLVMVKAGYEDRRPDLILKYEDAELIAAEFKATAVKEDDDSFDIVHRPAATLEEHQQFHLRPPIVTIMGHVDHGKTTLLDYLRKTTTAKGEPGGITQHIAAFSVPIKGRLQDKGAMKGYAGVQTVTFVDTPGHAAFSAMRSRGALMTDIVVLVVAADDGVMPQTLEVIDLVKKAAAQNTMGPDGFNRGIQMLVALNKTDLIDVDPDRVKRDLMAAGVELEEFGGNVPCVEISGRTGKGIADFEETLAVMAELADLRADRSGHCEGVVIESRIDHGNGPIATVLVKRGTLKKKDPLIAGTAWALVRRILHSNGRPLAEALPSEPVIVTGWRKLPEVGDEVIGGGDMVAVKRAVQNREARKTQLKLMEEVTQINERRRLKHEADEAEDRKEFEERQEKRAARIAASQGIDPLAAMTASAAERESRELARNEANDQLAQELEDSKEAKVEKKYLNLIVKGDVSGSVEAVVGAISNIGNSEAGIKIIRASAGEVLESDVTQAGALQGTIVAFNVKPSESVLSQAARNSPNPVQIIASDIIYRLMEDVKKSVSLLLEPTIEARVQGEATVGQVFEINIKGKRYKKIAGCKIHNGTINRTHLVRILRGSERKVVWQGKIDEFKHLKKDVTEMRKGTECGISFEEFQDVQENDSVQSIIEVSVPRSV